MHPIRAKVTRLPPARERIGAHLERVERAIHHEELGGVRGPAERARSAGGKPPAKRNARSYCAAASRWAPSAAARRAARGANRMTAPHSPASSAWWAQIARRQQFPLDQAGQDETMEARPPGRRERAFDDLPSELVSKRDGPTVVHEQPDVDARRRSHASGPSTVAASRPTLGPFGEQRHDIEQLARPLGASRDARASTVSCTEVGSPGAAARSSVTRNGTPPLSRCTSSGSHAVAAARRRRPRCARGSSRSARIACTVARSPSTRTQRIVARQVFAIGDHEHAAGVLDAATDEREEVERRGISPMKSSITTTVGGPSRQTARNAAKS